MLVSINRESLAQSLLDPYDPVMTSSRRLPRPTTDLAVAGWQLSLYGYCIVADAIDGETLAQLRSTLDRVAAEEAASGAAFIDSNASNQRIFNLVDKGDDFWACVLEPRVLGLVRDLLGGRVLLSSLTANMARPGGEFQELHQDQGFVPQPHPPYPIVANVAWVLDDVDESNGGTRLIPKSHRWEPPFSGKVDEERVVTPRARAGSAIVFDGRLWHGTGRNQSDRQRRVLLSYFCRPWCRQQENPFLSLSAETIARLPDELRHMLGFSRHGTLGGVDGPRRAGEPVFVG